MDSIKRSFRSLFRRLRRDKSQDERRSGVDPDPPTLPPLVPPKSAGHFDSFIRETTKFDDTTSPSQNIMHDSPQDTVQQIKPDTDPSHQTQLSPALQNHVEPEAGGWSSLQPVVVMEESRGNLAEEGAGHVLISEKRERPVESLVEGESHKGGGAMGQEDAHAFGMSAEPVHPSVDEPSTPTQASAGNNQSQPLEALSDAKTGQPPTEEKRRDIQHPAARAVLAEKMSLTENLPPMKKIVIAPGMSATSGPLEDFPEGGEVVQ